MLINVYKLMLVNINVAKASQLTVRQYSIRHL